MPTIAEDETNGILNSSNEPVSKNGTLLKEMGTPRLYPITAAILSALAFLFFFTRCTTYVAGTGSAVAPDRVWALYEGKAGDELSARIASAFTPAETSAERVRLFEVSGGFLLFVHPAVFRLFAKDLPSDGVQVWFFSFNVGAAEWNRPLSCPDSGLLVTSPLAFIGEAANRYYFIVRCLSHDRHKNRGDHGAKEWVAGISARDGETLFKEVRKSAGMWSAWIHGDYLVQTEFSGKHTRLIWENLKTGTSGSAEVEGQYRRGWLRPETASEWVTGEEGLARLKEDGGRLSLEPLQGADPVKLGRCGATAVYIHMEADRFLIACILGDRLSVASGSLSGLEAARLETLGKIEQWTDPIFPPEDLSVLEVLQKEVVLLTAGHQVFAIDLPSGRVKFSLTAKRVGIIGDRLAIFELRPPNRIAFRYHDLPSGKLLSFLQSDILKEPISVLSLLLPVRSGLVVFNLATGKVVFFRGSSLPMEAVGSRSVP